MLPFHRTPLWRPHLRWGLLPRAKNTFKAYQFITTNKTSVDRRVRMNTTAASNVMRNHYFLEQYQSMRWNVRHFSVVTETATETLSTSHTPPPPPPPAAAAAAPSPDKSSKKKHKKAKQHHLGKTIPTQSRQSAEALFDLIAPHLELKVFKAICKGIQRISGKNVNHQSYLARVGNQFRNSTKQQQRSHDGWLKGPLTQFLSGADIAAKSGLSAKHHKKHPTFTPSVNREAMQTNVEILMNARERSLSHILLWDSDHQTVVRKHGFVPRSTVDGAKTPSLARHAGENFSKRSEKLHWIHQQKTPEQLVKEAEDIAEFLADSLPKASHDKIMTLLGEFAAPEKLPTSNFRLLMNSLKKCVSSHLHIVAPQMAHFFYVDVPIETHIDENFNLDEFNHDDFMLDSSSDKHLQESSRNWKEERNKIVDTLLDIQHSFVKEQEDYNERHAEKVEEAEMQEEIVSQLSTTDEVKPKKQKMRRKLHLTFDAVLLDKHRQAEGDVDDTVPIQNDTIDAPPQDRMVFIDNLPIDMTEMELMDLYSSCGSVESIQIFNLRPDLDPGMLTQKKLTELRKAARMRRSFRKGKWEAKRTPVYALITFHSPEAHDLATEPPLRIFGMVIRRHPVRSKPASEMNALYVENVPPGLYSLDLEYKISRVLHPDLCVVLKMGQHDYSEPTSCEIRFPNFRSAHEAFQKLCTMEDLTKEGCTFQWMKTPDDAEAYWKKEQGFHF